jgi:hypothetical protein
LVYGNKQQQLAGTAWWEIIRKLHTLKVVDADRQANWRMQIQMGWAMVVRLAGVAGRVQMTFGDVG